MGPVTMTPKKSRVLQLPKAESTNRAWKTEIERNKANADAQRKPFAYAKMAHT